MSTRYVYGIYPAKPEANTTSVYSFGANSSKINAFVLCQGYAPGKINKYEDSDLTYVSLVATGGTSNFSSNYLYISTTDYPYIVGNIVSAGTPNGDGIWFYAPAGKYWYIRRSGSSGAYYFEIYLRETNTSSGNLAFEQGFIRAVAESFTTSKESYSSKLQSNETLIMSGTSADFSNVSFRKYIGSDNIDPVSVTYSQENPQAGKSVNILVSPRTPTYGGTVYYQYQYSTNGGGTWADIGSTTTSTSKSFTIPASAAQFRARVLASDGWGFTSSTYVYGENKSTNSAPTAPPYVSIPNEVYTGENFQISWGASTDPDGNLAGYEVQRSYDSGENWQSVSSSVAGTSLAVSVQEGHTSVRYRVRAKDAQGLTSTWTTSTSATIGQIKAYATVDGKLRAGAKMYATVGGKIRQVQKGYVTVGWKIRKLF